MKGKAGRPDGWDQNCGFIARTVCGRVSRPFSNCVKTQVGGRKPLHIGESSAYQSQSRQSAAYWPIAIGPILYRMYAGIRAKQLYPLIGIRLAAGRAGGNQAADSQVQLLDMQLRAVTEGHEVAISQDFAKAFDDRASYEIALWVWNR